MPDKVKILDIQSLTQDVKHFKVEKPSGYSFETGQACEVAINKEGWTEEKDLSLLPASQKTIT